MPIYTYFPFPIEDCKKFFASIIEAELLKHKLIQLPIPPKEEFLDVFTTALMLSREKSRVYAYVRSGILKAYKLKGVRGLRFKKHEVEAAMQKIDFQNNITKNS
jgi:hypothetical protein